MASIIRRKGRKKRNLRKRSMFHEKETRRKERGGGRGKKRKGKQGKKRQGNIYKMTQIHLLNFI